MSKKAAGIPLSQLVTACNGHGLAKHLRTEASVIGSSSETHYTNVTVALPSCDTSDSLTLVPLRLRPTRARKPRRSLL